MRARLIRYGQTPQITGLEYAEMRDLAEHPEKEELYGKLVQTRVKSDRSFLKPEEKK